MATSLLPALVIDTRRYITFLQICFSPSLRQVSVHSRPRNDVESYLSLAASVLKELKVTPNAPFSWVVHIKFESMAVARLHALVQPEYVLAWLTSSRIDRLKSSLWIFLSSRHGMTFFMRACSAGGLIRVRMSWEKFADCFLPVSHILLTALHRHSPSAVTILYPGHHACTSSYVPPSQRLLPTTYAPHHFLFNFSVQCSPRYVLLLFILQIWPLSIPQAEIFSGLHFA